MQTSVERDFAVSYYLWSLDQWREEVGRKFPFLKSARDAKLEEADIILQILEPLSADQALQIAGALLKSAQPEAARIVGEHLFPEENLLLSQLKETRQSLAKKKQFLSAAKGKPKTPRAQKRKTILEEVRKVLEPALGKLRKDSGNYYIDTPMGNWTLRTSIDVSGQCELAYSHDIPLGPEVWRLLASDISALSWLGINETFWSDLPSDDVPEAAKFILSATLQFMKAAPGLLPQRVAA